LGPYGTFIIFDTERTPEQVSRLPTPLALSENLQRSNFANCGFLATV